MKLTPQCDAAVEYARDAMARFGHGSLSTAHLLVGLLKLNGGVADLLAKAGLTLELAEQDLQTLSLGRAETMIDSGLSCGRSVTTAFKRAEDEARKYKCIFIGTDALLHAISCEEQGPARAMFDARNIDRTGLRAQLVGRLEEPGPFDLSSLDESADPLT